MEGGDKFSNTSRVRRSYCVTGATGYIGSWLVKSLLLKGFFVHGTLRDFGKASYLLPKWQGSNRLKLFKADLQDEGSFDEAVKGCDGVFHVAASMEFSVYVLSKLLSEKAAFKFANDNGLDLVSVITSTVAGPFLTSSVPSSVRVLLSPITGDPNLFPILKAVNSRMGSMCLVHINDICNAHIFLMEHPRSTGQYICCAQNCHMSKLVDLLNQYYPSSNMQRMVTSENARIPSEISSKKLLDLGFEFEFRVLDIIKETVRYCIECGYLPKERN